MRGRGAGGRNNGGGPPADLLVCFTARAHLALLPKPIYSPSRSSADAPKRHPSRYAARSQLTSPLFRFNTRRNPTTIRASAGAEVISEPTSPKVTCAGQIKVSNSKTSKLPASSSGVNKKSCLSVMEEMAELRHRRRRATGHSWLEALGLKKEAVHLLHGLRHRMRCFGSFRNPAVCCTGVREDQDDSSAGEDEEEEEDEEGKQGDAHQTIFSKWFMLLEESPNDQGSQKRKVKDEDQLDQEEEEDVEEEEEERGGFGGCLVTPTSPSASSSVPQPPPNALLLMRCRSAPSKGWPEGCAVVAPGGAQQGDQVTTPKKVWEDEKEKERLLLMSYAPDFFNVSPDIAKETWLAGSFDTLLRSRSWKR